MSEAVAQRGKKRTAQMLVRELDLTKIQGKGDFPCPTCGVIISPEDETDDVYTILKEKLNGDVLEELVVRCNKCSSQIRLTGFSVLAMDSI